MAAGALEPLFLRCPPRTAGEGTGAGCVILLSGGGMLPHPHPYPYPEQPDNDHGPHYPRSGGYACVEDYGEPKQDRQKKTNSTYKFHKLKITERESFVKDADYTRIRMQARI